MDIHHTGTESQNSTSVKPYVGILEGRSCLVYSVGILEDGVCQTCEGILETEPVKHVCGNSRVRVLSSMCGDSRRQNLSSMSVGILEYGVCQTCVWEF